MCHSHRDDLPYVNLTTVIASSLKAALERYKAAAANQTVDLQSTASVEGTVDLQSIASVEGTGV